MRVLALSIKDYIFRFSIWQGVNACVCVCVSVSEIERERENGGENERENDIAKEFQVF